MVSTGLKRGIRRAALVAAVLCAGVLLCIASLVYLRTASRAIDPYQPLIDAASTWTHRRVETRLAIDFIHKPFRRSTADGRDECQSLLLAAAATSNRSLVQASRAFAVMQLYCGDHDAAVSTFEKLLLSETHTMTIRAALRASTDTQLVANAAAAFYEHAIQGDRDELFSMALAATERALRLDSDHLSALFTRALTFERLGLEEDARIAWQQYLLLDNGSLWASEARTHLAPNRMAPSPRNIEEIITHELGTEWAHSRNAGRLLALETTASAIANQTGDTMARDTVAFVRRNPTIPVASALATYAAGVSAYKERRISAAKKQLDDAIASFTKWQCPVVYAALVQKSACRFYDNDIVGALAIAETILRDAPIRYRTARGKALWLAGLCQIVLGRSRESLRSYDAALTEFRALHDTDSTAAINTLLAELHQYMGDSDKALSHRQAALRDAYTSRNPFRLSMALSEAGAASIERGDIEIAAATLRRLVAVARSTNDPLATVDALMSYGRLLGNTKERAAAARAFDQAYALASQQKEAGVRKQLEAMITLRAAEAGVLESNPALDLDQAIAVFSKAENRYALVSSLLARGKSARRRGPEAERDFRLALDFIHAELDTLKDPIRRATFLEERQAVYDALVDNLAARDPLKAFQAADDAHHALLETYIASKRPPRPMDPRDIPHDTALVEYFISNDNIFSWVVLDGSVTGIRVVATADDVLQLAEQAVAAICAERHAQARILLRRLDELLLQPSIERIRNRSSLVIVPDRFLAGIPFAALVDQEGRYRIEQFAILVAISARHHAERKARWEPGAQHVGIVAIDAGFKNLSNLPEARSELVALRNLYPHAEVAPSTVGSADVIALIGRSTIAHVATHGHQSTRRPLSSGILLEQGMAVTAADVATSRFRKTQLVFLGVCESGATPVRRTAVGNVATAFLAAGVPNIVGVLWNVGDRDARIMAQAFHGDLQAGKDAQHALRAAQLRGIQRGESPLRWAAYVVMGGKRLNNPSNK